MELAATMAATARRLVRGKQIMVSEQAKPVQITDQKEDNMVKEFKPFDTLLMCIIFVQMILYLQILLLILLKHSVLIYTFLLKSVR